MLCVCITCDMSSSDKNLDLVQYFFSSSHFHFSQSSVYTRCKEPTKKKDNNNNGKGKNSNYKNMLGMVKLARKLFQYSTS